MGRIRPPGRKAVQRDAKASGKQRDALRRADTTHRRPLYLTRSPRCLLLMVLGTTAQHAPNERARYSGEMSL